jgi:selenide,water dikinase
LLSEVLAGSAPGRSFPDLLVGHETSDDAAVYRLNDTQALVATTDFFTPIVDDPFDFGRIAAANAISDVYAMGARPFMALAVLGVPLGKLPVEAIRGIVSGGAAVCREAGVPIAGGHSIDSPEPMYGLVAMGLIHPDKVKRNSCARAGDALVLGKPLGIGVLGAALKKGELKEKAYRQMVETAVKLNTPGLVLAEMEGVHALTDVTGFGLLGHLLEICRGSGLRARLDFERVPILSAARHLVQAGYATGASGRNWESYRHAVALPESAPEWQRKILTDPQTSGGLLVACDAKVVQAVLEAFVKEGFEHAAVIGRLEAGEPGVTVV